jgi:hypothetical protein
MRRTIVFSGPTLRPSDVKAHNSALEAAGPAGCGSIYRAAASGFERIALIDGYFDQRLPVWHKEILFAIESGCEVFGGASQGALRAAELDSFGMVGVGKIYGWFRDGSLEDDDEVAVLHEAEDTDYRVRSVAMVNFRATFQRMAEEGQLGPGALLELLHIAKGLHYSVRSFPHLLSQMKTRPALQAAVTPLTAWLGERFEHAVNLKRMDALALLDRLGSDEPAPAPPKFRLARTEAWFEFRRGQEDALARERAERSPAEPGSAASSG